MKKKAALQNLSLNQLCEQLFQNSIVPEKSQTCEQSKGLKMVDTELVALAKSKFDGPILGVVLFGSVAREQQTASSDLDLLIVVGQTVNLDRDLYNNWSNTKTNDGRTISPVYSHLVDPLRISGNLWYEIALDGIVLYDPESKVQKVLAAIRRQIANRIVERKTVHGHPYWVGPSNQEIVV